MDDTDTLSPRSPSSRSGRPRPAKRRGRAGAEIRQHLRKSGLSGHLYLYPDADVGPGSDRLGDSFDTRAKLEALLRNAERGARAVLDSAHAADARIVLALCRRARLSCFGDYAVPMEAAFAAAALVEKYERLKTSLLLGKMPLAVEQEAPDQRDTDDLTQRQESQVEAEKRFYRQRFVHYAGRFPEMSNRALRRLATVDARDAGWPLRPDSRYAKWTLDLITPRRNGGSE